MAIRISTIGIPVFRDRGLEVGISWNPLPKKLDADQRATLIAHVGRFIRIHPEDVGNLAELSLELVDGKLVEATKKTKTKTDAAKSGAEKTDATSVEKG